MGDNVYLRLRYPHLKSITKGKVTKLSPKYFDPFAIEAKVGQMAYRLKLPEGTQIHPVFHVSLLKESVGTQPVSRALPTFPKEATRVVEPKAILERRVVYKQGAPLIQVLVK